MHVYIGQYFQISRFGIDKTQFLPKYIASLKWITNDKWHITHWTNFSCLHNEVISYMSDLLQWDFLVSCGRMPTLGSILSHCTRWGSGIFCQLFFPLAKRIIHFEYPVYKKFHTTVNAFQFKFLSIFLIFCLMLYKVHWKSQNINMLTKHDLEYIE